MRPSGECDPTDLMKLDTGLPFYEHFYSGGVRDLRGYDDNTLGPKDAFCRSVGGDFKVAGGVELAFPTPFVGAQSGTRIALFVDTGYVYENVSAFELDKMRGSFGLSVTWEAPIGPIVISYAFPVQRPAGRPDRGPAILLWNNVLVNILNSSCCVYNTEYVVLCPDNLLSCCSAWL